MHFSPPETRADEGGSSAQPVLNAGNTVERVRAAGDDNSTQAADGEEQRAVVTLVGFLFMQSSREWAFESCDNQRRQ